MPADCWGQIQAVLHRYFCALDERDFDLLADCFTEDAVFEADLNGSLRFQGRAHLVEGIRSLPALSATTHTLSNTSIEVDGKRARATTHAVAHVVVEGAAGQTLQTRGIRYRDDFRCDDRWLISHRRHRPAWQSDAPVSPVHMVIEIPTLLTRT